MARRWIILVTISLCERRTLAFTTRIRNNCFCNTYLSAPKINFQRKSSSPLPQTSTPENDDNISSIKKSLSDLISATDRGRSAPKENREIIERHFRNLESLCPTNQPARDKRTFGRPWTVEYTTCPPPSNGQLGPFKGISKQEIDYESRCYKNLLVVPPGGWLSATLEATWDEWDGIFVDGGKGVDGDGILLFDDDEPNDVSIKGKDKEIDHGATSWRVRFDRLKICLFDIPVFTLEFENTERIWRNTYLDDDTRIVRAGRSGRREDEVVFYMTTSSG